MRWTPITFRRHGKVALAGLGVLLGINLLLGARLYSQEPSAPARDDAFALIGLFTRVLEQVRQHYVEEGKTSYKELVYAALRGMLQYLDSHSQFLDADMYKDIQDDTAGHFGGLGIVISLRDNMLTIVAPMEDTPGARAGLMSGDRITRIDGASTEGFALPDAVKRLRGPPGSKVSLEILRPSTRDVRSVDLERAEIQVASVKDAKILRNGIGYLRITQFVEPTTAALQAALEELQGQGLRALVVDLRNNPGGLLSSAIEVSGKFLERHTVVVSTEGRDPKRSEVYRARERHPLKDIPLAVLVNGGSASASEIFAGAMQDHHRGVLVGERTFGKGSVQSVMAMDEGTAIRLTTSYYLTPAKRRIHEKGIDPDIEVVLEPELWQALMAQRAREAYPDGQLVAEGENPPEPVRDVQLERAVDVLAGVLTFAGLDTPPPAVAARSGP